MSLIKWRELAKRKSELGNKINYVHDMITKHDVSQQTSQETLTKAFQPITVKLDENTSKKETSTEEGGGTKLRS